MASLWRADFHDELIINLVEHSLLMCTIKFSGGNSLLILD